MSSGIPGDENPTLASLRRIARALDVEVLVCCNAGPSRDA